MKKAVSVVVMALSLTIPFGSHAEAYQEAAVTNGGSITGKVAFSGNDPAPKIYNVAKDNDVCGTGQREIDYVKVNNGALMDVVVYLDKVKAGKPFPADTREGNVNQKDCEFKPFLSIMHNGASFNAENADPIRHNIHTYEMMGRAKKTVFNVNQREPGTITKQIDLQRGNAMKVECDAHDFMHAFVFVAKNPYYAVVKDDGTFSIDDVPPGEYTIKAWHGTLREQKAKVNVDAGGAAIVNFQFEGK